jgi:uncharacterized protein (TIGR02118 family)
MSAEQFQKYWHETHGPLCRSTVAMRRYVQGHTRLAGYDRGRTPAYDGVSMAWFESMDALRDSEARPDFARLKTDLENFVARDRSPTLLTTELVILP